MKTFTYEKAVRIMRLKKELEELLDVKLSHRGREITIDGSGEREYIAEKVLEAINFGFPIPIAKTLITEEVLFEQVPIKEHTRSSVLERVRGRIIGTDGKTLKSLSELTGCALELHENVVGIIGDSEQMKIAREAIIGLIRGSKHGNVYAFLEKHQKEAISDLGIKETFIKKRSE